MRTRFLTASQFGNAAAPDQTLDFLRLPLPHLPAPPPPPPHLFNNFDDLHYFDDVSSLNIEKFPIENALSKFFADSLPHFIDVDIEEFANDQLSAGKLSSFELHSLDSKQQLVETEVSEEKNDADIDVKGENRIEFVHFEVTEPDLSVLPLQESIADLQMENMQIFSAMSNIGSKMDMPNLELRQQDYREIEHSMYSVDDITPDYSIKQQADLLEEAESIQGVLQSRNAGFPLLEVDEASLGIFNGIYAKDELLIFENIEAQNWMQEDKLIFDGKEFLGSTQFDLLEYLSNHLVQCCKVEVPCLNFFQDMDFIISTEQYNREEICQERANDDLTCLRSPVLFEEFQFFGLEASHCFEVFSDVALESEAETWETKFGEAMNFRSFNELIVSHELTLMDDSFKSLPVPILLENEQIKSLHSLVEETLKGLEPQCSSTSDGLYLDWHFLEEDQGSCSKYSSCWKLLREISFYDSSYTFDSVEFGMLIFDFILSDDGPNKPNSREDKEILDISSVGSSMSQISSYHAASSIMLKDEDRERVNEAVPSKNGIHNVPSFDESKSHFNDLDFFLNPQECARGRASKPECSHNVVTACPVVSSPKSFAACATTTVQLQQWNAKFHPVQLSNEILILIDNFRKSFLVILENDTVFTKYQYLHGAEGGLSLLSLSTEKLMDCIQERIAPEAASAHDNDINSLLVTLSAIKQMAWYLIYYGVHATYLYINRLCRSMECFRSRLSFLHNLIEDAHLMAEKEIHKIHPSLFLVQEILQSNFDKADSKILIVAERIFWWPLERLLTSLKISYSEPEKLCLSTSQQDEFHAFTDAVMNIMLHSDCCLISHEFVSTSFPFNKFGAILEYGGSFGSSRVSTMSPIAEGCFCLHFLKVDLEDSSVAKAFCDGIEMPKIMKSKLGRNKLEDLLNFIPVEESYEGRPMKVVDEDETCSVIPPTMQQQMYTSEPSFPKTLIIVNTLNFDKEMVISRRSTYQKILAMEKEGAQVIERDLDLPIDVIVSAAVCLAWYDCKNIGKKATAPDEAFSCLPLCVENIAASILTSMSFSFSSCILVFEGESNYLADIMESSDELYAAAASLGIDLQLFYSYSSEMTDEIILSCIEVASKLTRGLYPNMPDSETLAESFLTAFPSINALSAHAILSSGGILFEFLEWSQERRIRAVQKYQVPDESIALLSALSRYGEQENAKSGMTDCSSSASSAPDPGNFHLKSNSERKKRRYIENHQNVDMLIHDTSICETEKQFSDSRLNPPRAFGPYSSHVYHDTGKSSLSCDDILFGQSRGSDSDMMVKHPKLSQQCNFFMAKGAELPDEIKVPKIHRIDMRFSPEQISEMPMMGRINIYNKKDSGILQEDIIDEVIDVDTNLFRTDSFVDNSVTLSKLVHHVEEDTMARIFEPFSAGDHRTFPTAAEIDYGANTWFSKRVHGQNSREGVVQHTDTELKQKQISLEHQKGILEDSVLQKTVLNSLEPSLHENNIAYCSETPLSNAIHSAQLQQGSPWTIEFLNRIREKSRQRRQSLPCGIFSPSNGSFLNAPRASKRKSPSILEYFKYQGGKTPKKVIEKTRQSRFVKPSCSSKEEKASASFSPTWTPVDKKARQTLSFATNGSGGQSKLVWREKNAYTTNRRF